MPSARRLRLVMLAVLAIVITMLFFTSKMRSTMPRDPRTIDNFFGKTVNGLKHGGQGQVVMSGKGSSTESNPKDHDGDGTVDADDEQLAKEMGDRLRAAEQKAKELANAKAPLKPDPPKNVVGVGSSAGGQGMKDKPKGSAKETVNDNGKGGENDAEDDDADDAIEITLNEILKKSPVVIFSKTYCPYSKRAKGVLLEKYTIDPSPYVVELDEHPLGKEIQANLFKKTNRKTVPNILINGESVGGGDDIADLDARKTLIDKFKSMGGKQFSMKERFVGNSKEIRNGS
ncbi:Uu.00g009010.m01.CDS01 [Anthostomella pinea]|uniref:Uu.00g009010.m01.CDS01 n=1 Tax=Anthostomella pinea TaxID=933095 RepID=A0AAI8YMK2_9PEZI|nr:Uu.00g009010.m01.CDS01 [Anthostomella pinea]